MTLPLALLLSWTPLISIGRFDGNAADLALGPAGYSRYGADPTYVAGFGEAKRDWPYVIPGPGDAWAGGRPHTFGLIFGVDRTSTVRLRAGFVGIHPTNPPSFELRANGKVVARWRPPAGKGDGPVLGQPEEGKREEWTVDVPARAGENTLEIASVSGSWAVFDALEVSAENARSVPIKPRVELRMEPPGQIERNSPSGPVRQIGLRLVNVGAPTRADLKLDGTAESVTLPAGATELVRTVRSADKARNVAASLMTEDGRAADGGLAIRPVRPWRVLVLPGGHVDVGYTHPQDMVAQIQAQNVRDALSLVEATRERPAGERYRWNSETAWATEQFLESASVDDRKRFETAVRNGEIAVSASYLNLLYGLVRPEESIQALTIARRTPGLTDAPHDTAMLSDVPGIPWGLATAMRESGVRNLVLWPNGGDTMRGALENRPFWWRTRDGSDRVFVWPMFPYSIGTDLKGVFHLGGTWYPNRPKAIRTPDPRQHFLDDWLPRELDALDARGYPYSMVGVPWSMGDNGAIDLDLPDAVAAWNRRYANPKLEITTVRDACRRFVAEYGAKLPTRAEEFNPQWEDGAASSSRETALSRNASERLVQAETAWTLSGRPVPRARFDAAWKDVLLYSEHTWGADESIRLPDSENTRMQWAAKAGFASRADVESRALLAEALGGSPKGPVFDILNTRGESASGLVLLDGNAAVIGAESQLLSDGRTAFLAQSVPALGTRAYRRGAPLRYVAPPESTTIDNGIYRLTLDPKTGAVASLRSLRLGREMARNSFASYGYILGADASRLTSLHDVRVETLDAGPLVWTLRVTGAADGVRGRVAVDYRLTRGVDAVEVTVSFDKAPVRQKEIAFFSFPFDLSHSDLQVEEAWSPFDAARQRFPAANDQFFSVDRWLHVGSASRRTPHPALSRKGRGFPEGSQEDAGVTIVALDTPIVVVGKPSVARLGKPQPFDPHASAVHFQLAQNHWHVNYRAEQSGPIVARFVLRADSGYSARESSRFAEGFVRLLLVASKGEKAPFELRGDVEVSSVSKRADGRWSLRLYNPSEKQAAVMVLPRGPRGVPIRLSMPPFGLRTVILRP